MAGDCCRECDAQILQALARLEKKVDVMSDTLHQIEVLKTRQGHHDEGLARAFDRIEKVESKQIEGERFVAFVRGLAWAAGVMWAIMGGGIIYVAGKVINLAVKGG